MLQILLNRDDYVSAWLQSKIPGISFHDCKAIGIIKNQKLIAAVVYSNLRDGQIEATIVVEDKNWANKAILYALFAYPFKQCNCNRILVTIRDNNNKSIKLAKKLGFKHEGKLRQMFPPHDAVLLGMLRSECKWLNIKGNNYGKVKTISTASA